VKQSLAYLLVTVAIAYPQWPAAELGARAATAPWPPARGEPMSWFSSTFSQRRGAEAPAGEPGEAAPSGLDPAEKELADLVSRAFGGHEPCCVEPPPPRPRASRAVRALLTRGAPLSRTPLCPRRRQLRI
jgi:hypothetical protein